MLYYCLSLRGEIWQYLSSSCDGTSCELAVFYRAQRQSTYTRPFFCILEYMRRDFPWIRHLINSPPATFVQVEAYMRSMASALFGVMATMGGVPIIRTLPGGPTQMLSEQLSKVRDATKE